ncbi:MAG: bifunctional demethylmenaquinone methyltransferase/2-methoxy-6-polyprenyl-1,4-benzoquinol methylase UbiE [Phycisphaerales bacterium]|nr:bifunctional demethylmenaquinone methyltransferase/2-methoxy-6-polyprenyl-1,4-benzoquinol methylase UbiE [Phycisphaerales bacterium]
MPTTTAGWTREELAANPHESGAKAEKVRAMFASIARSYDLNNTLHSFGRDAAWRRAAVRMARVRDGDEVLDAACGTGELTRTFARAPRLGLGRPARVVGLDYTPEMLDLARAKPAIHGPDAPPVSYVQGDAMALPFGDGSFDVVSIAFGIRNVAEPARALAEFRRVLRPGGRLVILEFSRPSFPPAAWVNDFYCGQVMPRTATLISRDRSGAYRYLPRSVNSFVSRDAMSRLIQGAGFQNVLAKAMTMGVCVCYAADTR